MSTVTQSSPEEASIQDGLAAAPGNESASNRRTDATAGHVESEPPSHELTEEEQQIKLLTDLIAAGDCDGLMKEEAIEALVSLHCSIDFEAEGVRLMDNIERLPGMKGRREAF